jgi:hypothetical protein
VRNIFVVISLCVGICVASQSFAQKGGAILFSGKVVEARTGSILPGAHAIIPKAGRGVTADNLGRFEMYVLPGDSVVFSFVGYKKQYLRVPTHFDEPSYYAVIALREDQQLLAEVKVYPYASEEDFKKAILEMKLENAQDREYAAKNLDTKKLKQLSMSMGMGSAANSRNFLTQQTNYQNNRNFIADPLMTFTNPFAWASFIKSIKNGDLKNDDWKKAYETPPLENISTKQYMRDLKATAPR